MNNKKNDRRELKSSRREPSGKMKEEYIDFFIPKDEEKRSGKDRRRKEKE